MTTNKIEVPTKEGKMEDSASGSDCENPVLTLCDLTSACDPVTMCEEDRELAKRAYAKIFRICGNLGVPVEILGADLPEYPVEVTDPETGERLEATYEQ